MIFLESFDQLPSSFCHTFRSLCRTVNLFFRIRISAFRLSPLLLLLWLIDYIYLFKHNPSKTWILLTGTCTRSFKVRFTIKTVHNLFRQFLFFSTFCHLLNCFNIMNDNEFVIINITRSDHSFDSRSWVCVFVLFGRFYLLIELHLPSITTQCSDCPFIRSLVFLLVQPSIALERPLQLRLLLQSDDASTLYTKTCLLVCIAASFRPSLKLLRRWCDWYRVTLERFGETIEFTVDID